jgi:hypothetical protein
MRTRGNDETIFAARPAGDFHHGSGICIIIVQFCGSACRFLESCRSLKRPCTPRAQYGWPFH